MLTQLQLEGPELEPLLVRVRSELGSAARIVQAEKVRSGGVAGFFARERYELTVEVDDEQPRTVALPPAALQHVEPPAAPAQDGTTSRGVATPSAPAGPAVADPAPAAAEPVGSSFTAVTGLGGPVDRPTDAYAPIAGLTSSARHGAHDAVLTAARDAFATHPAFPALADHVPAAHPVRAADHEDSAPRSLDELAEQVSDEEQAAVVSTESPSFASLMSQLGSGLGADAPVSVPADAPVSTPAVGAQATPGPADPRATDAWPSAVVPAQRAAPAGVAVRYAAVAEPAVDARTAVQTRPAVDRSTGTDLARLGLPAHLRPQGCGEQLHTALRAALTRLPSAPPATNRAGGVLAVVGPLALAVRVAREVAEELGLPVTTSVAVATTGAGTPDVSERQVLHAPAEAADRRATWRRRGNLTVVAVEAPLTSAGAADAREFLTALSPSSTWGVVEATRKAQDIGAWTRALGGVHALALTDVEETADPAAVLELGIPVSRLGGRPATPRAWATLLTGRLAA